MFLEAIAATKHAIYEVHHGCTHPMSDASVPR